MTFDGARCSDPEAGSGSGITTYRWTFGDGTTQETATPPRRTPTPSPAATTRRCASWTRVRLAGAAAAIPTVVVADATAPVVKLTAPTADQAFRVFVTRRIRGGGRTVSVTSLDKTRLTKVLFKGTATDDTGIARVALSVRRISVAKPATAKVRCHGLCLPRRQVDVQVHQLQEAGVLPGAAEERRVPYRFKRTLKPKAGLYAQSARALDTGGNASRTVTVRFPLK